MMSPGLSSFDTSHGGVGQPNVGGGGIPPFDQQDIKPRIPPSTCNVCYLQKIECTTVSLLVLRYLRYLQLIELMKLFI